MRFTIRDLLWLTVVVAVSVAWWADRRSVNRALAHNAREIEYLKQRLADATTNLRAAGFGGDSSRFDPSATDWQSDR